MAIETILSALKLSHLRILKTALNFLRDRSSKAKEESLDEQVSQAREAIHHPYLFEYLQWKYAKEEILIRDGRIYPVAIFPTPPGQRLDVDSVLKSPLASKFCEQEEMKIENSEFEQVLDNYKVKQKHIKESKDALHLPKSIDYVTFAMNEILPGEKLEMSCKIGKYFINTRTSECLEWEIRRNIRHLKGGDERDFKNFDRKLKLRSTLHEWITNPVQSGQGRCASIGISTLIAYNDEGTIRLLVRRRAATGVALRKGQLHVVPGAMFQAVADDTEAEFSVVHNIYREYLEEIFSRPEIHEGSSARYFYDDKPLIYLKSLLDKGEARLYFTGISVNLLNLRPEICTLLYIRNPEWYRNCDRGPEELRWNINREFCRSTDDPKITAAILGCQGLRLAADGTMVDNAYILPNQTVPAGAGAFWLGIDVLRDVLNGS